MDQEVAPRTLRGNRSFHAFWASQILSVFGDSFTQLAVPLLVLDATGSVAKAGLLTGAMGTTAEVGVLMGVYFACVSVGGICSMSLRQQVTPEHLLGRVTSAFWTIHFSLGGLGAALFTWLAEHHGTTLTFLVSGAGCLVVAALALATPVRQAHPA